MAKIEKKWSRHSFGADESPRISFPFLILTGLDAEVNRPRRSTKIDVPPGEVPLPEGWEMHQDSEGRTYFVDTINKDETYDDPRDN